MKICRFCEGPIDDQAKICGNCGYNPKTDTLTASFVKKEKKAGAGKKQKIISPGVKTFVFWGVMIIVFSLGIKYQGKFGDILWEAKNTILGNKISKSAPALVKINQKKVARLIDVRSYKIPADKASSKNRKIEGIFYDPQGKSYVVINGRLVSEKESFENMVIKKINSNSVEVLEDGNEKALMVNQ